MPALSRYRPAFEVIGDPNYWLNQKQEARLSNPEVTEHSGCKDPLWCAVVEKQQIHSSLARKSSNAFHCLFISLSLNSTVSLSAQKAFNAYIIAIFPHIKNRPNHILLSPVRS